MTYLKMMFVQNDTESNEDFVFENDIMYNDNDLPLKMFSFSNFFSNFIFLW